MQRLDGFANYTEQEVIDALHAKYGARTVRFRYDVLDKYLTKKHELKQVVGGSVKMAAFSRIKRTASLTLADEWLPARTLMIGGQPQEVPAQLKIDYLSDRIQIFCEIQMKDGDWISFSLGIFIPSTPARQEGTANTYREIELYDGLIVLDEDKVTQRYFAAKNAKYTTVIRSIIGTAGITRINIEDSDLTIPIDREWDPGTPKLDIVNDLLEAINFTPLWCDANGFYTSSEYRAPSERPIDYQYADNDISVIHTGMSEELDMFNVPNSWVVVRTNTEQPPLIATKTNNSVDSPTSIINRGRTIVDFREVDDIANQTALNAFVIRIAAEASQIYGKIEFETAIMPMHEYSDSLSISYKNLEINDTYSETAWEIDLKAGGKMKHEARKVVDIG